MNNSKTAWYAIFILTLANISSFIDRQILSLLVKPMKQDLHLTDFQVSLLMGLSFALFYTFFGVIIGRLADSKSRRNIIIVGISLWSLMTSLCAGAGNYIQFFLARMGVGVGEATLAPSAYSMIADMFPKKRLATALSVYSLGVFLGSGLAVVIGSVIVANLPDGMVTVPVFGEIFPWQLTFLYVGLPGLVISLLLFTIKEPARTNTLQRDGKTAKLSLSESLAIIFKHKKAYLLICFSTGAGALVNYGSNAWIPTFVARTYGWDIAKAGSLYGLVLIVASISGVLFGGWYADRLVKKGVTDGRLRVGLISGVICLLTFYLPLLPKAEWALLMVFFPSFAITAPFGAITASIQEIMPNQVRALASSIFLFILNLIGIGLGPSVVAFFTDYIFKDESMIRYSIMMLYIIGGVVSLTLTYLSLKPYREAVANAKTAYFAES